MKLYPWTETKRELEARIYCVKCGASNIVLARTGDKFWMDHEGVPTVRYCDACQFMMRLVRRKSGVEVLGG